MSTAVPFLPVLQSEPHPSLGLGEVVDQYADQLGVGAYFLLCAAIYVNVSFFKRSSSLFICPITCGHPFPRTAIAGVHPLAPV